MGNKLTFSITGFTYPATREHAIVRISNAIKYHYENVEVTVRLIDFKGDFKNIDRLKQHLGDFEYIIHTEYEDSAVPWGDTAISQAYIEKLIKFVQTLNKPPNAIIFHPGFNLKGLSTAVNSVNRSLLKTFRTEVIMAVENRPNQCVRDHDSMRKLLNLNDIIQLDIDVFQLRTATKKNLLKEFLQIISNLRERIRCLHIHWNHAIPNHPKNKIPWKEIFHLLKRYQLKAWYIPEVTSGYQGINETRKFIIQSLKEKA